MGHKGCPVGRLQNLESLHIALWLKLLVAAAVGIFAFCAAVFVAGFVRRSSGAWRRRLAPGGMLDFALLAAFVVGFAWPPGVSFMTNAMEGTA